MRVLVTGGAGFIGSHVVDRCLAAGHQVAVVDDLSTGRRELVHAAAALHVQDIRSPALDDVFRRVRPDAVIHHAAQAEVRRSVADPRLDAEINVLGSINVLECARRHGARRFVYASSGGAAYGDTDALPTPEEHPTRPESPYGISKRTVEDYVDCWQRLYGISGLSLRYANVYGPRQSPQGEAGVVAIFSHRLLRGEGVTINGDGLQTRDYVYVEDVADANVRALDRPDVSGVVNIGTGVETSVVELFRRLCAVAEAPGEARHGPPKPGEQRRSALAVARAARRLDWAPGVSLDEGLRRTVAHFRLSAPPDPGGR